MYPVDGPQELVSVLERHLPDALPVYGALKSHSPIQAWSSFQRTPVATWVVVVKLLAPSYPQYRIYCSAERDGSQDGEALVIRALDEIGIKDGEMLGAVHALWAEAIRRRFVHSDNGRATAYNVWLSRVRPECVDLHVAGYEFTEGREDDVALVSDRDRA